MNPFEQLNELRQNMQDAISGSDYALALTFAEQALVIIQTTPDTEYGDEKSAWRIDQVQQMVEYLHKRLKETQHQSAGLIQSQIIRHIR